MSITSNGGETVRLAVDAPEHLSRLTTFLRIVLVLPHYLALYVLAIIGYLVTLVSWFAVLVFGRYPEGMFDYMAGWQRWSIRVIAYLMLVTDRYPPFTLGDVADYPIHVAIDRPARVRRWRPLLAWLFVLPAAFVAVVLALVAELSAILAWFAILITGRYPRPLFGVVTMFLALSLRVNTYMLWMNTRYPLR